MRGFIQFLTLMAFINYFTIFSYQYRAITPSRKINLHHKLNTAYVDDSPTLISKLYTYIEHVDDIYANGSILSYANTTGFNYTEPIGTAFLLTNVIYLVNGISFLVSNPSDSTFYYYSFVIELAGILSINYHFNQLYFGPNRREVKIALFIDYIGAISAIFVILAEIINQSFTGHVPFISIELALLGSLCLIGSWVCLTGYEYIVLHSLWHLFSGAACYELYSHL